MPISKRNRRGIVLLILLVLLIVLTPRLYGAIFYSDIPVLSFEEAQIIEEELVQKISTAKASKWSSKKTKYKLPSSKFDPNDFGLNDWTSLGLSEKQASVVLKFSKYGIKSNEELQKIYVIPVELFDLIKDSTVYKATKSNKKKTKEEYVARKYNKVNINTANKEGLMSLPGIGDYFAGKMITYRSELGGFNNKHQLLEIWKFDADRLEKISEYLILSKQDLVKVNINQSDVEGLVKHPYVNYKIANSILKIREMHGMYSSIEGIKKSKLIDEELFLKLKPYLTIQ